MNTHFKDFRNNLTRFHTSSNSKYSNGRYYDSTTTFQPVTEEPLTSSQKILLYTFLGVVAAFLVVGFLRAVLMRILHGQKEDSDSSVTTVACGDIASVSSNPDYYLESERRRRLFYNQNSGLSPRYPSIRTPLYNLPPLPAVNHRFQEPSAPYTATMISGPTSASPFPNGTSIPPTNKLLQEMPPPTYNEIFPNNGEPPQNNAGWTFPPTKTNPLNPS